MMFLKVLIVLASLAMATPAWSWVEVKMTYTGLTNQPETDRLYNGSSSIPKTPPTAGLGGDLIFQLPFAGLNFGMRYENLGLSFRRNGLEFDGSMTRSSVLFGWRWVDTLVYFGPLFTYGASHSGGQIKVTENGTTISDLTADKQTSYSAGLELGRKLDGFRVGVEAGYMNYLWNDLAGSTGSITSVEKLDMSGTYVKLAIGFGI